MLTLDGAGDRLDDVVMAHDVAAMDAPPPGASNRERISWEFGWLNRHDVAPLVEHMWTAETEMRFPDKTVRGPEQSAEYLNGQFAALDGWHMDIIAMAGEGEDVFVRWRLTGRHAGPLFGVAPTGRPIAVDGIDHFVLRERQGRVAFRRHRRDGVRAPDGADARGRIAAGPSAQAGVQHKNETDTRVASLGAPCDLEVRSACRNDTSP